MLNLRRLLPRGNSGGAVAAGDDVMPLAVLEFQSPTAAVIATPVPLMARSTNYFVSAMFFSMLIAAAVIKVEKLVTATGETVSSASDFNIQAYNTASIVQNIYVHPGEIVKRGQVLATLDPTTATANLSSAQSQEQEYAAEVAELQAQESGKPYIPDPANPASTLQMQTYNQETGQYNFTMQDYTQKIGQLQTEIDGFDSQAAYYQQRLGYAQSVLTMRAKLEKLQVGSHLDTLAAEDTVKDLQSELASAVSSADADQKQLASQEAERNGFDQQWKAQVSPQLATALNNLYQAQQSLAQAKLNNQLITLTAPQDAIVQSVAGVANGSVLPPGQAIMDLAPAYAPLIVQAQISADESGLVHVGNEATIKFSTLPFLQYGLAKGIVTSISPESVNPLDTSALATYGVPPPGTPQTLYYNAEISIDVYNLHNLPDGFQLVPGMPVEADLVVGKRSILGFFAQRIEPVAFESMHEP